MLMNRIARKLLAAVGPAFLASAAAASPVEIERLADTYVAARVAQDPGIADQFDLPIRGADRTRLLDRSPVALERLARAEDRLAARLARIDRRDLAGEPRVLHALLTEELTARRGMRVCRQELWDVSHYESWLVYLRRQAETTRVDTADHHRLALKRWHGFPTVVDQEIANLRVGQAEGYAVPAIVLERVVAQLKGMTATPPDESPYYAPARRSGDAGFAAAMREIVATRINPALDRYRAYLETQYRPRDSIALSALPNGADCFRALTRLYTTLDLTPDELFAQGERLRARGRAEAAELSFKRFGTRDVAAVRSRVAQDPSYGFPTRDDLWRFSLETMAADAAATRKLFRSWPTQPVEIVPYPRFMEGTGVAPSYTRSTDPSRPGLFRVPLDQHTRFTRYDYESVPGHEALPGHHLLQSRLVGKKVHPLRRLVMYAAFDEGWAQYSERLRDEVGRPRLLENRIDIGHYRGQGHLREVGIHMRGWGGKDIAALSGDPRPPEVIMRSQSRHAGFPVYLIVYELGEAEIEGLRAKAEAELGDRFDIRDFHEAVLGDGMVPLWFMRQTVEMWIAAMKSPANVR
jgi:uncharacterized protein (DUF885 family)